MTKNEINKALLAWAEDVGIDAMPTRMGGRHIPGMSYSGHFTTRTLHPLVCERLEAAGWIRFHDQFMHYSHPTLPGARVVIWASTALVWVRLTQWTVAEPRNVLQKRLVSCNNGGTQTNPHKGN